jgi:hypothetical protein
VPPRTGATLEAQRQNADAGAKAKSTKRHAQQTPQRGMPSKTQNIPPPPPQSQKSDQHLALQKPNSGYP